MSISAGDKVILKAKAKKTVDTVKAKHGDDQFATATRWGEVQIQSVEQVTDENGVDVVEVFLKGQTMSGDPHYRIINPPMMVRDPDGSMHEDPILALAETLARFGGARKGAGRR